MTDHRKRLQEQLAALDALLAHMDRMPSRGHSGPAVRKTPASPAKKAPSGTGGNKDSDGISRKFAAYVRRYKLKRVDTPSGARWMKSRR